MAEHNELGRWGEDLAADYLKKKGYYIAKRDWKCGHRDIDIVAVNPERDTLVIVEVKTRSSDDYLPPEQAVDYEKRRNLLFAANILVKQMKSNLLLRFDIITIVGTDAASAQINHIENAFKR